jgi:hypothetical protein
MRKIFVLNEIQMFSMTMLFHLEMTDNLASKVNRIMKTWLKNT